VGNELVGSLLDTYRHAPTLEAAEQALEALESCAHDGDPPIGDLYDELAELAAQEENFGLAVRAQRKAVELGCDMPRLGREMLGWYLMKDGRRAAGEAEFDALRTEVGDDPGFLLMLGNARADAGDESAALAAFDEALTTAKQLGDSEAIKTARADSRTTRTTDSHPDRSMTLREGRKSALQWPGSPGRSIKPCWLSGRSSRRTSPTPTATAAASNNTCASWPRPRDTSHRSHR